MDVFDLVAKIRLDSSEYEQGVGKAKGTFSSLASGVKTGLATVAKVGGAAIAAGAAGVAALTKMGVEGYAQYEQLVGGVETLFKTSQGTVMKYAENAYKTAGMSANQYMETVTSFSASLIQSLDGDTAKAAEVGNMAITDMSDNANKMGTSMEMIQNAYQGFAKQNYTMLDNLKLGYGGTQEEMQRLIDDANRVKVANGEMADLSIDSFADVTEAIHIIQTEMGITGTTSREAATTIEGSISMMKGAWQNLVVGMADENANMEVLINNFVESAATAAQNLMPRIEQTLVGIGALIEKLAPVIGEAVPRLVETVLPTLLAAGIKLITALVSGIVSAAPGIYQALLDAVYIALTDVFGMSEESANGFIGTIDGIIRDLVAFFKAGFDAVADLFNWLVSQAQTEGTYFNAVWENIKTVVTAAIDIIRGIIKTFTAILKGDWSGAWEAVKGILSTAWDAIKNVIGNSLNFIKSTISNAWNAVKSSVSSAINGVKSVISSGMNAAKSSVSSVLDGIKSKFTNIWDKCKSIVKTAVTALKNALKFNWELPKIKLPHISVSGGKAPYGIGGKGSLPKFSIEWYKKAYDNAMILRSPTIFGYSAASGKFLGGGDGNGNEIVAGESYLMNLIGNVVAERNGQIVELLAALLEATVDGNSEMLRELKAGHVIAFNERELGRTVRGLA